jgi:hypothetical protein
MSQSNLKTGENLRQNRNAQCNILGTNTFYPKICASSTLENI